MLIIYMVSWGKYVRKTDTWNRPMQKLLRKFRNNITEKNKRKDLPASSSKSCPYKLVASAYLFDVHFQPSFDRDHPRCQCILHLHLWCRAGCRKLEVQLALLTMCSLEKISLSKPIENTTLGQLAKLKKKSTKWNLAKHYCNRPTVNGGGKSCR